MTRKKPAILVGGISHKAKTGRPQKDIDIVKNKKITIRVTEDQYDQIVEGAMFFGKNMTQYMLDAVSVSYDRMKKLKSKGIGSIE